jgi:hypothetical protein
VTHTAVGWGGLIVIWAGLGTLAAQQLADYVKLVPPSSFLPPVIMIRDGVPDKAQICLEATSGLTSCKSIGDFRQWVKRQ